MSINRSIGEYGAIAFALRRLVYRSTILTDDHPPASCTTLVGAPFSVAKVAKVRRMAWGENWRM